VVRVLKAFPVRPKLLETILVDVGESSHISTNQLSISQPGKTHSLHGRGASRHLSSLPQALDRPSASRLVLAEHIVLIVVFASRADKEGRRQERGRRSANLLDLWD
jgi:hypothetical protein